MKQKTKKLKVIGGVQIEPWIKAIPESQSHGSGTLQKRLWRLVSDYVRIRDWHAYRGKCVASGAFLPRWQDGNAGHFKPYSRCNGLFKFDPRNIFLQKPQSNILGSYEDWISFEEEILRRTGMNRHSIDKLNQEYSLKFSNQDVVKQMELMLNRMKALPEQPDYFQRVQSLRYPQ